MVFAQAVYFLFKGLAYWYAYVAYKDIVVRETVYFPSMHGVTAMHPLYMVHMQALYYRAYTAQGYVAAGFGKNAGVIFKRFQVYNI